MQEERKGIKDFVVAAVISGTVAGALIGGVLTYYFDGRLEKSREERAYQVAALEELAAPAVMYFAHSKAAADRYSSPNNQYFGDAAILNDANRRMRDLLLARSHLLPQKLAEPSQCLIAHYDIWVRRFDAELAKFQDQHQRLPQPDEPIDIGFAFLTEGAAECGDFPEEVPGLYVEEMKRLRGEVFKEGPL